MPRVYASIEIPRVRRSLGCSPILGTCPLLEHALLSYWDRHALVTCLLKLLGHARFCDMPFNILGTSTLWRHSNLLGQYRSWYMPFNILETSPCVDRTCDSRFCFNHQFGYDVLNERCPPWLMFGPHSCRLSFSGNSRSEHCLTLSK